MNLTGSDRLVLQVHTTRKCNLRCPRYCPAEGPEGGDRLQPGMLGRAIAEAAELGYERLNISGGEPMLFPDLIEMLAHGRINGLETNILTGGLLLSRERIAELKPLVDLVAIDIGNAPDGGIQARPVDGAPDVIFTNLRELRAARLPFAISFTLTRDNFGELPRVAEFAYDQGAAMLEVRPAERAGCGFEPADVVPTGKSAALAWLMVELLRQRHYGQLPIQFHMYDRGRAATAAREWMASKPLLPSPLVIEPDGTVAPFRHGFPRRFAVGNLSDGSLPRLLRAWEARCGEALREIARETLQQLTKPHPFPFVNLYDRLCERAAASTLSVHVGANAREAFRQAGCCV